MEKKYINLWTGKIYIAKKFEGNTVTLVRDKDGYNPFIITVSELNFSFKELEANGKKVY